MKSFQVADFNAPLQEVDQVTPQPEGTQVLIRVRAAGVCHSDLHIWEGGYDLGHGRKPLSLRDRGVSLPRTMGHETVGDVGGVRTGRETGRHRPPGDRRCRAGLSLDRLRQMRELPGRRREHVLKPVAFLGVYCDGGYADHMIVPHPRYLLNLRGLDPRPLRLTPARASPPTAR